MKIVLASRNKKKKVELQTLLSQYIDGIEILSLDDVGIYGEIEEDGETFEENALIKANAAVKSGYIGVGDDSGLEVSALGGAPGVYSARYAGEHGNDEANNAYLLKNLEGKNDRSARFVCCIACVFPEEYNLEPIGEKHFPWLFKFYPHKDLKGCAQFVNSRSAYQSISKGLAEILDAVIVNTKQRDALDKLVDHLLWEKLGNDNANENDGILY